MKQTIAVASLILFYSVFSPSLFAQQAACGGDFSLVLCRSGEVEGFGSNNFGQLAAGVYPQVSVPTKANALTGIKAVTSGYWHSVFLKEDSTVLACGYNGQGQLGDGTDSSRLLPVQVLKLNGIVETSANGEYSLYVTSGGIVWGAGYNPFLITTMGNYLSTDTPVQMAGITNVKSVAAGNRHILFLKTDSTVWSYGENDYGQLGDSSFTTRTNPVKVEGLHEVVSVAAGNKYSLFLKADRTVWACGKNSDGQLGIGSDTSAQNKPVLIDSLSDIKQISAKYDHSLFLKNDATVWACGSNTNGKAGLWGIWKIYTPMQLTGIAPVSFVAAGYNHSLLWCNDSTAYSTGLNSQGQLGQGNTTLEELNVLISGLCEMPLSINVVQEELSAWQLNIESPSTSGSITGVTSLPGKDLLQFSVIDMAGRTIHSEGVFVEAGQTFFSLQPKQLSSGIYLLHVSGKKGAITHKLVVDTD